MKPYENGLFFALTPRDCLRVRVNRVWLIAKTARCARSFCFFICSVISAKYRNCQLKHTGRLPERGKAFSFRCAEFASFFASEKPSKRFFSDFNTPRDCLRVRVNRVWLIAKTARFARSFCDRSRRFCRANPSKTEKITACRLTNRRKEYITIREREFFPKISAFAKT